MVKELPELLYDVKTDVTEWPLVVLTTPETVVDENLAGFLADFHDFIIYKNERFSLILDVSQTSGMTPKQRKIQSDSMNKQEVSQHLACVAMVFKSKMLSRVLTAIMWLKKSEYPVKVFSSVEDAKDWVRTQM